MLAQSAKTHFRRKITYTMLSQSAFANIAHKNYLCNVDPKLKNNIAQSWSVRINIAQRFYLCYVGPWLTNNFLAK